MATAARQQVYLSLKDALEFVGVKINLFAVVAEIGSIIRSRGTDYVLTLKIADQSLPVLGISLNFFAEDATRLPHVKANGDIICLQHVTMKNYNGNHYCLYDKRVSSFALFKGKTSVDVNPYEISSKYCRSDGDNALLLELRRWSVDHPPTAALKESTLQLRNLKVGVAFDLVCKVLHVRETFNGERILFVWDGTDAPPLQFQEKNYNERTTSSAKRVPLTCFPGPSHILEVNDENTVYTTLMDSLTHNEIAHRSKCIVRVVAACPWHAEHLYSPVTGRYCAKVTLEDPTARIHAYIVREDADRFFGAIPEPDLAHSLNALLGIVEGASGEGGNSTSRDPPWVWCCLRSYYLQESDPWDTRRYRICDTELVG